MKDMDETKQKEYEETQQLVNRLSNEIEEYKKVIGDLNTTYDKHKCMDTIYKRISRLEKMEIIILLVMNLILYKLT